jgi:prepilin-type processing-associated H-X9-DG protein
VLVALLLPAVQSAREAARRMSCQSNLKQIGIACHNFHDTRGTFPSGHKVTYDGTNTRYFSGWAIQILPYIEQDNLFKQYDDTVPNLDPKNKLVRESYVATYACPAELKPKQILIPETQADTGGTGNVQFMIGSYRGMGGVSATGFDQWAGFPTEVLVNMQQGPGLRGMLHTDWQSGVAPERMANITDGTSNTLLVGERSTRTHMTRGTFWADSFNLYSVSGAYSQSASLMADYDACIRVASDQAQCKYGWGSFHPQQINYVFGDGSVRTIKTNIDMKLFTYLATIGNGETTQEN